MKAKRGFLKSSEKVFRKVSFFFVQFDWMLWKKNCRNFFIFDEYLLWNYNKLQKDFLLDEHAKKSKHKLQQILPVVSKAYKEEKGANHHHASVTATRLVPVQDWPSQRLWFYIPENPKFHLRVKNQKIYLFFFPQIFVSRLKFWTVSFFFQ